MTRALKVLVLDADAATLVAALRAQIPAEVGLHGVARAEDVDPAAGFEVCLAQPDLFAAAAERLPALRWVQSSWAGVGPMVPVLRQRPGVAATCAKGIFGTAVSEYVLGWLLALDRRLLDYSAQQRQGLWAPLPQRSLAGRKVLLLGVGSIGSAVASRLASFGMDVVGVSRSGEQVQRVARTWRSADRVGAARGADLVVSSLPATPATRGVVDARLLAALAPGAVLINVGRGSAVNQDALLDALGSGHLRAAVLDVFDEEPLPAEHPLWTTSGVHITPHVAAPTRPSDIARLFAANLQRWRSGRPLEGLVDAGRGY